VIVVEVDFICADDALHSLDPRGIRIAHGGSEERPCRPQSSSRSFRIYDLRGFNSLCKEANPSIDLPQSSFAVLIVGVFTAIAIASSPRQHLHKAVLGETLRWMIKSRGQSASAKTTPSSFSSTRISVPIFRSKRFGGTGMVELETGLPIGSRSFKCQHASAGGMAGMDLRMIALDFFDRNCKGCEKRVPVRIPNLSDFVAMNQRQVSR